MVGWHHRLDGREFEQAPGDGEGHRNLECCSPGAEKSQTQLSNWTTTITSRTILQEEVELSFANLTQIIKHGRKAQSHKISKRI